MSSESVEDSDTSEKEEEEECFIYGYYCAQCKQLYCSTNVHHDLSLDGKLYCFECYWSIKHIK
jgi:hypothetical protein